MADGDTEDILNARLQIGGKPFDVSLSGEIFSWKLAQVNPSQRQVYHHLKLSEILTADIVNKYSSGGGGGGGAFAQGADGDGKEESTDGYQRIQKTNSLKEETTSFTVYAVKNRRRKWRVHKIKLHCPDSQTCKQWVTTIKETIAKQETQRPKRVIVYINPVGGKCQAKSIYNHRVAPLFKLAGIHTETIITETSSHAKEDVLQCDYLDKIDGIVCVGGDGTFAEVVNGLLIRTQGSHGIDVNDVGASLVPPNLRVGVIPAGSTDVIAYTTTGVNDPVTSALQIILGYSLGLDVCSVHSNNNKLLRYTVSALCYGFFGDVLKDSENYRWIGPHRYDVAGAKKYLRNQSYCGEVSFLPSTDEDHNPWDKATCRVGCGVCLKRQSSSLSSIAGSKRLGTDTPPSAVDTQTNAVQSFTDPDTGWKTLRGDFTCVNAAIVSGMCGKSPHGLSPTAHLGNGCVDLMLVRKCSRINYLRHMLRLASGANHLDFNFVDVHRVKAFKFRPLRPDELQNDVSYHQGNVTLDRLLDNGSLSKSIGAQQRVNRQGSMTSISSWNMDGEIGDVPDVDVRVHCQLINIFARGRESAEDVNDSIKCCSFGTSNRTLLEES